MDSGCLFNSEDDRVAEFVEGGIRGHERDPLADDVTSPWDPKYGLVTDVISDR